MIMHDYNREQGKIMLLIHPMLSGGDGLKACITDYMGDCYRYLLPDLAGHGDAASTVYRSAKEEAAQIHDYMIENGCQNIQLGYCASLGGCVLFELLKYEDLTFSHLFFEGASLYEHTAILYFLSTKMYTSRHRQAVKDPSKSVQIMSKLYGDGAAKEMSARFIKLDEESIKNICHDCSYVDLLPLSEEIQARCVFAYGEKEFDLRNSRKVLRVKYPKAKLLVWKGLNHCERISKDSAAYAAMLTKFAETGQTDEPEKCVERINAYR